MQSRSGIYSLVQTASTIDDSLSSMISFNPLTPMARPHCTLSSIIRFPYWWVSSQVDVHSSVKKGGHPIVKLRKCKQIQ